MRATLYTKTIHTEQVPKSFFLIFFFIIISNHHSGINLVFQTKYIVLGEK